MMKSCQVSRKQKDSYVVFYIKTKQTPHTHIELRILLGVPFNCLVAIVKVEIELKNKKAKAGGNKQICFGKDE